MSAPVRKIAIALGILLALAALAFAFLPALVEAALNRVGQRPPYATLLWARELMKDSVDLHADPLLWGRDLLQRSSRGQVDLPRLQEADAALQVFGVVTQAPFGMNVSHNSSTAADLVTELAVVSRWPRSAWTSRRERALYLAQRLRETEERSGGQLLPVRSRAELLALFDQRAKGSHAVGALLALEGAQALEGDLAAVDELYDAGFRMMAPAHFTDTEISGSAHGAAKGGLTPLGRRWLRKLEEKKIIVDLAHASPQTVADVLALATRPVAVSHTGVKATCDSPRNLSDAQLAALKKNGALVGIGYFPSAVCGADARAIAKAMRYAADVLGVKHLALGSDFDGAVKTPFDVTGLPLLAEALRAEGFSDPDIRAIASRNALRFFAAQLP
jgi:microsomal dipeptidase-like Zn-dependent dipeptidase